MAREPIPGIPRESEVALQRVVARLEARLASLEATPPMPAVITGDAFLREGTFVRVQAPAAGLNLTLPKASPFNRGQRITLSFENANPVRIRCKDGTVNRGAFVLSNLIGCYDAVSDGETGWLVFLGLSTQTTITPPGDRFPPGRPGTPGPRGISLPGPAGAAGAAGARGPDGRPGEPGRSLAGTAGATGATGTQGAQGLQGRPGDRGLMTMGSTGASGASGPAGPPGMRTPPMASERLVMPTAQNPIPRDYMLAFRGYPDALNGVPLPTGIPNLDLQTVWTHHTFEGAINNLHAVSGFTAAGDMTFSQRTLSTTRFGLGLRARVPLGGSGYAHLGNLPTQLTFSDPGTLRGFRVLLELQTVNAGDDYDFMIGFGDDISDMVGTSLQFGTNSLFFRTQGDGAGGFSWGFSRQSAGVASNPTGPVGVVGDIVLLEAYRTSGTTWQFYVNGVGFSAGSANVPTTGLNFGFGLDDDGGGAVPFVVDIYQIDILTDVLGQRFS